METRRGRPSGDAALSQLRVTHQSTLDDLARRDQQITALEDQAVARNRMPLREVSPAPLPPRGFYMYDKTCGDVYGRRPTSCRNLDATLHDKISGDAPGFCTLAPFMRLTGYKTRKPQAAGPT